MCLANHQQKTIPTTSREKDALVSAGLGEKRYVSNFADIVHNIIIMVTTYNLMYVMHAMPACVCT